MAATGLGGNEGCSWPELGEDTVVLHGRRRGARRSCLPGCYGAPKHYLFAPGESGGHDEFTPG